MHYLLYNIGQVLGIAILHSLWQGLLLWVILRLALISLPNLSAVKKYNMAAAAMLGIAAWFMITLFNEAGNLNWRQAVNAPGAGLLAPAGLVNQLSPFKAQADGYYYVMEGYLPYISILYAAGLVVNLFKLSYCRVKLHQIKKALFPAGDLQWLVDNFSKRLNIRCYVRVNFSSLVDVPCMIGYLQPIILLPVSLAANLTVAETEAILLHELAHIKRNDYLINLLQQVVNSLLFFNPFAQIISRLISAERENCCDDLVVRTTQKPLVYARALLKLEESRQSNLQLVLAASTKKHYLLTRIERIMKTQQKTGNIRHLVLAILILAGSLSSIAWLNPEFKNGKITLKALKPAEAVQSLFTRGDTSHKKTATPNDKKVSTETKSRYKVQKFNENQRSTREDVYQTFGINDPQLDKLTAEVNKYAAEISKYYDSEKFKAFSVDMDKRSKDVNAFYNSDRIKAITEDQQKAAADYQKAWDGKGAEMEKIGKQMELAGNKMVKYYNTKEFKDLNTKLGKKYNIDVNGIYDPHTEKYKEYKKDLEQYLPADILKQRKEMELLGSQMSSISNDPELLKQRDRLSAMSDSIRSAYNNPQVKQQQEEMRKLGSQMRAYADNPEMKKQKEMLKRASEKLRAYTNSPEFKAKMKKYSANQKTFRWDNDNDNNNNNDNNNDVKVDPPPAPPAPIKP